MGDDKIIRGTFGVLAVFALLAAVAFLIAQMVLMAPLRAWSGLPSADATSLAVASSYGQVGSTALVGVPVASQPASAAATPYLTFTEPTATAAPSVSTPDAKSPVTAGPERNEPATDPDPEPDDPPNPAIEPEEPLSGVWVFGTVYVAGDGLPIAGVVVRIQGSETSATTDAAGAFVLPVEDPDSTVRIRADLGGTFWRTVGPPTVAVTLGTTGGTRHDFVCEPRKKPKDPPAF